VKHANAVFLFALWPLLTAWPVLAEQSAGRAVDDRTIASEANVALSDAKAVPARDIDVEVHRGAVQLAGFIGSEAERGAALAAASKVSGVTSVIDSLVVLEGPRSLGETVVDGSIQAELKTRLMWSEGLGTAIGINTDVRQGEVLLSGFIHDARDKVKAAAIAREIAGVRRVHDEIVLVN
jgi:osmotically-inducible protein OsmY